MSDNEILIQTRLEELLAVRSDSGKPLTHQLMADRLNAEAVPSLSGKPWSKYSVSRTLKKYAIKAQSENVSSVPAKQVAGSSSESREEVEEPQLKDDSPLMRWNYYESIRGVVSELLKEHHSEKSLATELNKMGVLTADGTEWDKPSVLRALKVLKPSHAFQVSYDVIRQQIKDGHYDTEEESFVCVKNNPKKAAKKKLKKQQLDTPKKKHKGKGEKKKGKGKKGKKR